MQAPGWLDLVGYQGASFDYSLTWQTGGTPVDLSGYSARMQVRETVDSTAVVLSLTAGTGITLGGTAGTIFLEASAATMAAIDAQASNQFVYDLELVSGAGYVTRLLEGTFTVSPEVTR